MRSVKMFRLSFVLLGLLLIAPFFLFFTQEIPSVASKQNIEVLRMKETCVTFVGLVGYI